MHTQRPTTPLSAALFALSLGVVAVVAVVATLSGCSAATEMPSELAAWSPLVVGDVLVNPPRRPASFGHLSSENGAPLRQALGPNGHHIIYLNYEGVTLSPSYDDSKNNLSSIAASVNHAITVPPFNGADYDRNLSRAQVISDVNALVAGYFKPFNVDVVTARPAQPNYVMVAIGGMPDLINQPCSNNGCVLGLAPLDCQVDQQGVITYNAQDDVEVVYAFSATAGYFQGQSYQTKLLDLAVTIAQETAHAYGLGHANNTRDIMYPQTAGNTVGFLDVNNAYADTQNCARGQGTQNSYQVLLATLGSSMGDHTPPTISITAPVNHSSVGRTFTVTVNARDNVGVDHVDYELNGPERDTPTIQAAPFSWTKTVGSDGTYHLVATAVDAAGNLSTPALIDFDVRSAPGGFGAACVDASHCVSGLCVGGFCTEACGACPAGYRCNASSLCEKGAPAMMTTGGKDGGSVGNGDGGGSSGNIGDSCSKGSECGSGLCANSTFCTAVCDLNDATSCPDTFVCTASGDATDKNSYCQPGGAAKSGCSVVGVGPRSSTGWGAAWLLALALPALIRRRRPS